MLVRSLIEMHMRAPDYLIDILRELTKFLKSGKISNNVLVSIKVLLFPL